MKKKIILITLLMALLFPLNMFALNKEDYKSKNLEETLTEENIEHDLSKYKENDKQVTIYLFRGKGCGYCKKFLNFLNSIVDEYGEYFKLESYEVWNDSKNVKLMDNVAEFLDKNVNGVPFIIIGDTVYPGYNEQYNDSIKSTIKSLYESKEKYDVFEEIEKKEQEEARKESKARNIIVITTFIFVALGTSVVVVMNNKNTKMLTEKIDSLEKEIKSLKTSQKEIVSNETNNKDKEKKNKK